jgi:hypothetical protein
VPRGDRLDIRDFGNELEIHSSAILSIQGVAGANGEALTHAYIQQRDDASVVMRPTGL